MKISKYLLLITLSIATISMEIVAQNAGSNQALMESTSATGVFLQTFSLKDNGAVGTPYLNEEFFPAKISIDEKKVFSARYNAYNDEFEIKIADNNIQNLNKAIDNITIKMLKSNETFGALNYMDSKTGLNRGYFIFLTPDNENARLYGRKTKKFIEAKPAQTGYDIDKPAEFKDAKETFFIAIGDGYAQEVPKKKKEISKIWPEKSKEINSFVKSNKIKTSKEEDLIKLVNYINTL